MTMTIRLLGAPLPSMLIFSTNSDSDDISDDDYDSSFAETCYPVGLTSDCGGQVSELLANDTKKKSFINPCRNMQ